MQGDVPAVPNSGPPYLHPMHSLICGRVFVLRDTSSIGCDPTLLARVEWSGVECPSGVAHLGGHEAVDALAGRRAGDQANGHGAPELLVELAPCGGGGGGGGAENKVRFFSIK